MSYVFTSYVFVSHVFMSYVFMTYSTAIKFASNVQFGASFEEDMNATTNVYSWSIDSTNGLFKYFEDSSYVTKGVNYLKPKIFTVALSYISNLENMMSINFEHNQVYYNDHLNLKDYIQSHLVI